jgi:hypothetical protein
MPKFRVLGEKPMMYWTVVDAKDSYEAYDKADKLNSVDWIEIETDNTIEPVDIYQEEEEQYVPLIEDEEEFVFDQVNVIGGE